MRKGPYGVDVDYDYGDNDCGAQEQPPAIDPWDEILPALNKVSIIIITLLRKITTQLRF